MNEVMVSKLTLDDRLAWEALFRSYLEFYGTKIEPAGYDRAWDAFQRDEIMHALGASINGRLVGIVHFLEHPSTTAADFCYLQDLFTPPGAWGEGVAWALISGVGKFASGRAWSRVYWVTHEAN